MGWLLIIWEEIVVWIIDFVKRDGTPSCLSSINN